LHFLQGEPRKTRTSLNFGKFATVSGKMRAICQTF